MHDTLSETPMANWLRNRFGIEDADELQAVLANPDEMLALLDVARASNDGEMRGTAPLISRPS